MALSKIESITYTADFEELKQHVKGQYVKAVQAQYLQKYKREVSENSVKQVVLGRMKDYRILNEVRIFFGLAVHYSELRVKKSGYGLRNSKNAVA